MTFSSYFPFSSLFVTIFLNSQSPYPFIKFSYHSSFTSLFHSVLPSIALHPILLTYFPLYVFIALNGLFYIPIVYLIFYFFLFFTFFPLYMLLVLLYNPFLSSFFSEFHLTSLFFLNFYGLTFFYSIRPPSILHFTFSNQSFTYIWKPQSFSINISYSSCLFF